MRYAAEVTTWVWLLLEIGLRIRDRLRRKGSTENDGGTRLTLVIVVATAANVALFVMYFLSANSVFQFSGAHLPWQIAGSAIMWLGLVVRIWAIIVLGSSFRTTVEVDTDQTVVDRGPYRWVRHPSYTGILLIMVGLGLAAANWISLVVAVVLPIYALSRRIDVEEKALVETLGHPYEEYRTGTKRLVPGLW
ncbi:isoprenylcysteine carboxylmethyltransferase family protein [Nocardia sp. NPDC051756]|uniref:methyltransferase family protein n=1 Tax=Nocardia sp. NPDC051756 TaxID=3154751 RepID=UPI00341DACE9